MSESKPFKFHPNDPFGLKGLDLHPSSPLQMSLEAWTDSMRSMLESRWKIVAGFYQRKELRAELRRRGVQLAGKDALEHWFREAKEDHEWRVRLLNRSTLEGQILLALMKIKVDGGYMALDQDRDQKFVRILAGFLDVELMGLGYPLMPPVLQGPSFLPVEPEKMVRGSDGLVYPVPVQSIVIPRRFSKARAERAVNDLLNGRGDRYWEEVRLVLVEHAQVGLAAYGDDVVMREDQHVRELHQLIQSWKSPFEDVRTRQRPSTLSDAELAGAQDLYDKWISLVRARTKSTRTKLPNAEMEQLWQETLQHQSPKVRTLAMVVRKLELSVAPDTLARIIK